MNVFIATVQGATATLTPEESWHCAKVLRNKSGDTLRIIDGKGNSYEAVLTLVTDKKCEARITAGPFLQQTRNYNLHLAIAPTKQLDRIEWMLEKAVEIGINEVTFILCANSERKHLNVDRLRKIAESAVKQSLQSRIPIVNSLIPFSEFIARSSNSQKFIAHCSDASKEDIKTLSFANKSTIALIGPEGDFTKAEIDSALASGFRPISLGTTRLRTETAGLYVVQAAAFLS
jgi:16S rRNA (uracil1498-N3)-methyltransferase